MPRWLAHLLVVVGWLLTPVLAWGASFFGVWIGALLAAGFASPLAMLLTAAGVALVCGFGVLWIWVRFMRRVPHLLSHHMAPRASQAVPGPVILVLLISLPRAASAQVGRDTEVHYGWWLPGDPATTYEFRTSAPLAGEFTHGFGALVIVDDSLGRRRAFYGMGWEVQAFRPRSGLAPYGVAGIALGLQTDTTNHRLAAHWSIGGGVEWRPVSALAVGVESRLRIGDQGPRGFWRAGDAKVGFSLAAGVSLRLGRGAARRGMSAAPPREGPPVAPDQRIPAATIGRVGPPEPPATIAGNAADVVRTALLSLGSPYQWGGTAENGFDCSGLIQYAYGRYGIRLPRMSRDQAQSGTEIPPEAAALIPGDILLFSAQPGSGVTHVGMYVGEGKFIHSSSTGVRLSRLDIHDTQGAYWLPRWVGARRIIP